jgi:HSP20 family protein
MASVIRWDPVRSNPFRELEEISNRFNRFFERLPAGRSEGSEAMTVSDWMPTVDIVEDDKEYLIKAEIPEVDKKDVKVTVQDGILTVQGERKKEKEDKGKRFHRVERFYGTFMRSFALPENAAEDNIRAEFKDGMLMVHVPKVEKPKPKQVEVKVA